MLPSIVAPAQLVANARLAASAPPGDFAEVGVFHGGSAEMLYRVARVQKRGLHLFDTFTGTPCSILGLDKHQVDAEFAAPEAEARIRAQLPEAKLYVGIYPETHPAALPPLAFVHCDCDQYASYIAVIDHMWPLVVPGGILLFDDYPYLGGAKQAVEERFAKADLRLCLQRYFVVKPRE